jgi:hypothetical protein
MNNAEGKVVPETQVRGSQGLLSFEKNIFAPTPHATCRVGARILYDWVDENLATLGSINSAATQ